MPRQLLTFVIVFGALMLVMRSCSPKPSLPPAVATATPERPEAKDLHRLVDDARALTVELARDGTLVSARADKTDLVRLVPSYRRPFHLLVNTGERKEALPWESWTSVATEDGGRRFTCEKDGLKVVKTIRVAVDGNGLDLDLAITGAGEDISDFWVTAVSGAVLTGPNADDQSGGVWQLRGGDMRFSSLASLVQGRESERTRRLRRLKDDDETTERRPYALRELLDADAVITRFGLLGATHYVALEDLPPTSALNFDVYRAKRATGVSDEIESWVEVIRVDDGYTGTFKLRWGDRAKLAKDGGTAFERSSVHRVENDIFRADFTDRGGAIRAMWLKKFSTVAGEAPSEENWVPILREGVQRSERALALDWEFAELYGVNPGETVWQADVQGRAIRFTLETPKGWTLRKTITLPEEGYALIVDVEVQRPDGSDAKEAKFRLVGPSGVYIADAYRGIIGAEPPAGLVLERSGGDDEDELINELAEGTELLRTYSGSARRGLFQTIALRGAYFVSALVAETDEQAAHVTQAVARGIELDKVVDRADGEPSRQNMMARITCALDVRDGRGSAQFLLYAGPNSLTPLRELDIEGTVDFGIFGFIGRPLMWLMKFFQGLIGSFGISIMLMTLVVRALLMPMSYKMQLGMSRYQKKFAKIKPILAELEKKYGKNPQKMNQERMRVMKEHKVGLPLGCLTMFMQIPIWISLFSALRVEFALRHEPFLWAADLSMPDRLFALPFWPGWFNFLPILMLVLWVTQQKMAPKPGGDDPQVQMQMKMMKFMPFMFFFMLYNYAAALAVYMCVSSTWGIFESRFVRKAVSSDA